MTRAIVIFGAAVGPDGRASPSLRRRAHFGFLAAQSRPDDRIFCSGGVGRFGGSEAALISELLTDRGVDSARIVLDEVSTDTLQNTVAAARFIRSNRLEGAVACTDAYHLPRVQMLFSVLGIDSVPGPSRSRGTVSRLSYKVVMGLREVAAYPYDLAIVLRRRRELLEHISS